MYLIYISIKDIARAYKMDGYDNYRLRENKRDFEISARIITPMIIPRRSITVSRNLPVLPGVNS